MFTCPVYPPVGYCSSQQGGSARLECYRWGGTGKCRQSQGLSAVGQNPISGRRTLCQCARLTDSCSKFSWLLIQLFPTTAHSATLILHQPCTACCSCIAGCSTCCHKSRASPGAVAAADTRRSWSCCSLISACLQAWRDTAGCQ